MSCCVNPFQPYPENVIWLCAGESVPAGWVETSRFEFDCGSAVVVWPEGLSLPEYPSNIVTISVTGGVVSYFNSGGVNKTQIIWRTGGTISVSAQIAGCDWALIGGGGSGGNSARGDTFTGGGGASSPNMGSGLFHAGEYAVEIGAGGAATTGTNNGSNGSNSVLRFYGIPLYTSLGGGYGGVTTGGNGGNGGGAGNNSISEVFLGGTGTYHGGRSYPNATNSLRKGGGGAGAGGNGTDGASGINGAGGPGIVLPWSNGSISVCLGGNSLVGTDSTAPGSGSVGRRQEPSGSFAGQDGAFILVFPTANATVI